jgi:hypothetical protein
MFELIEMKSQNFINWEMNSNLNTRLELYTNYLPAGDYIYTYCLKNIGCGSFLGTLERKT